MGDHDRGQIDTSAAEVYDSLFVPALFGRFSARVLEVADPHAGEDVVDVACGTGALTHLLRERTSGRVVGVDLNPAMLEVAGRRGPDIDWIEADAAALPFDDGAFGLATCQFGLMFFPEPALCLAEMARVARGGTLAVWDVIDRSPGYLAMRELFRDELGDEAASSLDAPFALGAPGILEDLVQSAGIERPGFVSIDGTGCFASIAQWVTTEVRGWTLGASVDDDRLADLIAVADERLAEFASDGGAVFGIAARVAHWPT